MKRNTLTLLGVGMALALSAGAVQAAGRSIDNPFPMNKATTVQDSGVIGGGYVYTGRPNDNRYVERQRTEGNAEFAVMDVHGEATGVVTHAHNGRPMDNPHWLAR
jgi:hypothetical protein